MMKSSHYGFTMIEIVFVIVVIGFAILSIPLVMQHSSNNLKQSSEVKGFYHALALMQIARVKPWDKNNIEDLKFANIYYVLDTDEAGYECKTQDNGFRRRDGMGVMSFKDRRYCSNLDEAKRKASEISGSSLESINFDKYEERVGDFNVVAEATYVDSSTLMPLALKPSRTSNTKLITITLSGKNPTHEIAKYYYYATNIGTDSTVVKRVK